jgi:aminoglycoside 6'-N-acetyltransferase I
MKVRHAVPRDADGWLALRCALWPHALESELRSEIEQFFAGSAREPHAVLLAEADSGEIVGMAELSIRTYAEGCASDRVAYLEGWYIAPHVRRRGIGRALVAVAEQWGMAQGCTELASDTEIDNEVSRVAHLECGFAEVERIRCFRKELTGNPDWKPEA